MPVPSELSPIDVSRLVEAAEAAHRKLVGRDPAASAVAPGSWCAIGEHTDVCGGVVLVGIAECGAGVSISPRSDEQVQVHYVRPGAEPVTETVALAEQQPFGAAAPSYVGLPEEDCARRVAGVMHSVGARQLMPREFKGADVTVVSTIPAGVGLGERAAEEAAVLLALAADAKDRDEAPLRARLAEIACQAAAGFSPEPVIKARYSAILRGQPEVLHVVDYRDGSLTQAPHVSAAGVVPLLVSLPEVQWPIEVGEQRQRAAFVEQACKAFGVESLRQLPEASPRVAEWLAALHGAQRGDGLPSVESATRWLDFFDAEYEHSSSVVGLIRSRRELAAVEAVQRAADDVVGALAVPEQLVHVAQLCREFGALGARPCTGGAAFSVLAWCAREDVEELMRRARAASLVVWELGPGSVAAG